MKNDKIYLTFQTDVITSGLLKELAHALKMTQPELINKICKDYVENAMSNIFNGLEEHGIDPMTFKGVKK